LVSEFSVLGAVRRFSRPLILDGGGCFWPGFFDSIFGRTIDVERLMNLRRRERHRFYSFDHQQSSQALVNDCI
jgi:hypothetical protein